MGAPRDMHIEIYIVKSGYVLGVFIDVLEIYAKERNYPQIGTSFRETLHMICKVQYGLAKVVKNSSVLISGEDNQSKWYGWQWFYCY